MRFCAEQYEFEQTILIKIIKNQLIVKNLQKEKKMLELYLKNSLTDRADLQRRGNSSLYLYPPPPALHIPKRDQIVYY